MGVKDEKHLIVIVLVCGYSLYGGFYLIGSNAHGIFAEDNSITENEPKLANNHRNETNISRTLDPFNFKVANTETGFNYSYKETYTGNNQLITNAGVYVSDYNNDGWTDILVVGGNKPILFENSDGDFHRSGELNNINRSVRAALFVDYNNNGFDDLLLLSIDKEPLLLENNEGKFRRVDAGFKKALENPIGAAAGDFDKDGCVDLYIYQYGNWEKSLPVGFEGYNATIQGDNGNQNYLYKGDCKTFKQQNHAGVSGSQWSLSASFVDLNNDSHPDIHVTNDFNYDIVYINQRNGSFNMTVLGERTNRNGMSSEVFDVNGDRRLDIFVTNIYYPEWAAKKINNALRLKARGNNLLINQGDGIFFDRAKEYGVEQGGWGWASSAGDYDNDGDQDLFQATRDLSFKNRDTTLSRVERKNLRAKDMYNLPIIWEFGKNEFYSQSARETNLTVPNGRGVAQLDFNNDGQLDLIVATPNEKGYQLYKNTHTNGSAIQLKLDTKAGSTAYGAEVYVTTNTSTQWRKVHSRTDFLSQETRVLHIGVGDSSSVDLRIVWPDGREDRFRDIQTDQRLYIEPGNIKKRINLT